MLQPGELIDIWVVEKALGAGGMGSVYRCHNKSAKRIMAAIKVLTGAYGRSADAQMRFVREAEILFGLDHPNIVKVRNVRIDHDPPYIEMEFVEGQSLEGMLERGALPLEQALDLLEQILGALAFLHDQGIRHRDIKPANVLVKTTGVAKLVDFGLAVETDGERFTQANMTFGTVSYAPPEWIRPDRLEPHLWDIYATGVMAYEMLTGEVAFPVSGQGSARQQAMQVIVAKQDHPALDPGEDFDDSLRDIIRRMTHPRKQERPQDAREVLEALGQRLPGTRVAGAVRAAPPAPRERSSDSATWMIEDIDEATGAPPLPRDRQPAPVPSATPPMPRRQQVEPAPTGRVPEKPTILLEDPPPPRRRLGWLGLTVGLIGAFGLLGLCGGAITVALVEPPWAGPEVDPLARRDVGVEVVGLSDAVEVSLAIDGQSPDGEIDGLPRFRVRPGDAELLWAVGPGCEAIACSTGACAAWCASGHLDLTLPVDELEPRRTLDLSAHAPSEVALTLTVPDGARVAVDGQAAEVTGTEAAAGVLPGPHTVRVTAGTCPEDASGCWPDCPAGCASWEGVVEVPRVEAHQWSVPVEAPARATHTSRPDPGRADPVPGPADPGPGQAGPGQADPGPEASAGAAGPLVTQSQFADWLAGNPDWQREAAVAAGRADEQYLAGWSGTTPPSGSAPMVSVSWYAAAAYCRSRGGLADFDQAPLTWAETGDTPAFELRTRGGRPTARAGDGAPSAVTGVVATNWTGFRCAR